MMTESKIILPLMDNDGVSLRSEREAIERMILSAFGGFNRSVSSGAWMDPKSGKVYHDDCMTYVIAGDWSSNQNRIRLEQIAAHAAELMRQECIYLNLSGQVAFVAPDPAFAAAFAAE